MRRTLLRKNRRQGVITHLVVDKQAVIKTGSDVLKVVKNNLYSWITDLKLVISISMYENLQKQSSIISGPSGRAV